MDKHVPIGHDQGVNGPEMNDRVVAAYPSDENVRLAQDLVHACNAHDIPRVEAFYAADYEGEDVSEELHLRGPNDVHRIMAAILKAFPDLQIDVEQCVAEHDTVVVFWVARGTHRGRMMNIPPTGRHVETRGVSLIKVSGGKIVSGQQVWDMAGMLRSMGLLPDLAH